MLVMRLVCVLYMLKSASPEYFILQVFYLMESIELVVRQFLNTTTIKEMNPDTDVKAQILNAALKRDSVLHYWNTISQSIPAQYEHYSMELLRAVVQLWINVRGHSFARDFTMNFESKFKKGTRKTLIKIKFTHNTIFVTDTHTCTPFFLSSTIKYIVTTAFFGYACEGVVMLQ